MNGMSVMSRQRRGRRGRPCASGKSCRPCVTDSEFSCPGPPCPASRRLAGHQRRRLKKPGHRVVVGRQQRQARATRFGFHEFRNRHRSPVGGDTGCWELAVACPLSLRGEGCHYYNREQPPGPSGREKRKRGTCNAHATTDRLDRRRGQHAVATHSGIARLPDVSLVAVCNRRPESTEALAREFAVPRRYVHWQELVADPEVDAVVIGTWPYLHCAITWRHWRPASMC